MSESSSRPPDERLPEQYGKPSFGGFSLSKGQPFNTVKTKGNAVKIAAKSAPSKSGRANLLHQGDDGNNDEVQDQLILGLGSDEEEQTVNDQPLIIPTQANKDWRLESLRRRGVSGSVLANALRTAGGLGALGGGAVGQIVQDGPETLTAAVQSGLVVRNLSQDGKDESAQTTNGKVTQTEGLNVDATIERLHVKGEAVDSLNTSSQISQVALITDDDIEQAAVRALLNGHDQEGAKRVDVIHVENDADWTTRTKVSEDEAYRQDIQTRPPESTLEDYENVPVHEFGAALLRGMGWKEGEVVGKNKNYQFAKPKASTKRPAFLGIGATPRPVDENEEALFGLNGRKSFKPAPLYTPLVRVSKTGVATSVSAASSSAPSSPRTAQSPRELERNEYRSSHYSRESSTSSRRRSRSRERDRDRDRDRYRDSDSYRHRRQYGSDQDERRWHRRTDRSMDEDKYSRREH